MIELLKELQEIKQKKEALDLREKEIKSEITNILVENGTDKYEDEQYKVNYIAASESVSIDTTALKKTSGELYIKLLNDYPKITKRSASLRVSFK
ncbi:MAG: hypothetical protein PT942_07035 [Eubacteriales bacterium]|nr:hypothetical protein [Eubacteriales bacterium]